jgi:regulator of CtrA degradation
MATDLLFQTPAISFGDRLAASRSFKSLFRDGMALVEETAAYLDGDGREEAKRLPRAAALSYASESMRLTTRLMQIASWLLLQRAVNEGEMTPEQAASDKRRTRIAWQQLPDAAPSKIDLLPEALQALVDSSMRLQDRIVRLDTMMIAPDGTPSFNVEQRPLEAQMSRLREAFEP